MSWITDDWRLKLLALGLAVLMLGAVAFSQNPPTTRTLPIPLSYTAVGPDPANPLVILNPQTSVNVTFTGLADVIGNATPSNFTATVDASHATPGQAVKLNIIVTPTINVQVQNPAPIVVAVDKFLAVDVPVQVNERFSAGWSLAPNGNVVNPPTVRFVGPASWETHLSATVVVGAPIAVTHTSLLNQPVQLANSNGALPLPLCTTHPCATVDPASVAVDIAAVTGASSLTVPIAVDGYIGPAAGYQVTGISVSPSSVIITGDPAVLAKIQRIILPKVDLSGATATTKSQVNIPYPDGVSPLSGVQTASIVFTIQKVPSATPSPSP